MSGVLHVMSQSQEESLADGMMCSTLEEPDGSVEDVKKSSVRIVRLCNRKLCCLELKLQETRFYWKRCKFQGNGTASSGL